ncbi:hypothetical protein SLEP1_g24655 [Rubroshorea leprosula]|uniref:Uncharacterized protein n=1 Tax=Rubroshorea leprosula TaxID=152421 RepID=A0AAV5JGK2_9ROSI|nr:hypothetical protein SLEP1_g24655 [Rubroshorea leprosula]
MSSSSSLSEVSNFIITCLDLILSPTREIRDRSESEVECERELIEDPNYSPPLTPCSESYEIEMSFEGTLSIGREEEVHQMDSSESSSEVETFNNGGSERSGGEVEKACSAPRGHWMPINDHYLSTGLRFLVPELLMALLKEYGLGMTQIVPNAVWLIIGFLVYCRTRGVLIPTINEMKQLLARGKTVALPNKRSKTLAPSVVEERTMGGTSRPHPSGRAQVETGMRWASTEVPTSSVTPLRSKMPWLRRMTSSTNDLTSELKKVREELVIAKKATELKEKKRKKCEENLAKAKNQLAKVKRKAKLAVHNLVEQHVSSFIKSVTFSEIADLYWLPTLMMAFIDFRKKVKAQNLEDEARRTVFPPHLEYEFVTIDKGEADVLGGIEVEDNVVE